MEAFHPILLLLIIGSVVWLGIDIFWVGYRLVRELREWLRGRRRDGVDTKDEP